MSVTNYQPDKCKYFIGKLVKSVWLVSEEAIKDIRIDNGEAWVESISETPIRLDCYSIELTDTDSLDERYKFTHTLTFSIQGYANKDDFQGRYYAIVKDDEGTYWLVNPLFPCKVTYTYTLGNEQNHTDFTLGTVSNHPVLKLNGMVDSSTYQCKDYWFDGIDALWLNEKRYTVHNGNHVMYTNGGFKTVEYNSKSATFTETFDGTNTSHGIEFDVLFSAYQKSWHYNLLEFKDNLYAAVIKTMNDKYALCGFSLGLQPGFQVSANDTNSQIDKIHITLNDAHDVGDPIEMYDSIEYEYLSAKTWVYTDEYDGWECVDEGVARYLLQMEIDALENETGNYKALDGYASRFPYLNIVDTFDSTETFENVDCGSSACRLRSSLPSQLTFNDTGCQTYYVKAGSDWEISSSVDYIRVSPSTGSADESYVVSVCNDIEPSDTVRNSSLTIEYCETSRTVDVSVVQYDGCFTQGSTYNIPANAKVMALPSQCCINSARETTYVGVNIAVYQDYLQVTIPENNTGAQRTIVLLVTYCDGTTENIVINQSDIFEKWEMYGAQFCIGNDLYRKEYLYTGTTPSSYTRTETSRDVLIERYSLECLPRIYKWVQTLNTTCVYEEDPEPSPETRYLTIIARGDGNINFSASNRQTYYYSRDNGELWIPATSSTTISVVSGDTVQFRGALIPTSGNGVGTFSSTIEFDAEGNPMSLLYDRNFIGNRTLNGKDYAFSKLFYGSRIINANRLALPATTLSKRCYRSMFNGCWRLETPPDLPATTLEEGCYMSMFVTCWRLETAPILPASTVPTNAYSNMFKDCDFLENVPEILSAVTSVGTSGCAGMFSGCNSLKNGPTLFSPTSVGDGGCAGMFSDCNHLTTAPSVLPATSVGNGAYEDMFNGCQALVTAPDISATTIGDSCCTRMFSGCTSLTTPPSVLPATTVSTSAYTSMFQGCTALTASPDILATNLSPYCFYRMFRGCTSLTTPPSVLSATTLVERCYGEMFNGCHLNTVTCLATTGIDEHLATYWWLANNPQGGTFYKKAGVTWPSGENGIPNGWTVIEV